MLSCWECVHADTDESSTDSQREHEMDFLVESEAQWEGECVLSF